MSTRVLGTELTKQLNADNAAQQELGAVKSSSIDLIATAEATQKAEKNVMVFHVVGDKASGEVHAEQANQPGKMFKNAKLILSDGKEVPLGF